MKTTIPRILMTLFAIGLCADVLAAEKQEYPQVSLCGSGGAKSPTSPDQFITLVVDGPVISYDGSPIPINGVVDYVNVLLKTKDVSYIGVYTRVGTKYGDVIRAIDLLRGTKAKNIGLSMTEIPVGREP
jgi:biopolymer transport protein ExbD